MLSPKLIILQLQRGIDRLNAPRPWFQQEASAWMRSWKKNCEHAGTVNQPGAHTALRIFLVNLRGARDHLVSQRTKNILRCL